MIERLISTTCRLKSIADEVSDVRASVRLKGKWSMKDHIGHLVDLEDIHTFRLREFLSRKPELFAADMKNQQTEDANHNSKSTQALLESFSTKRKVFVNVLSSMDDQTHLFQSLHPRLKVLMRPIDVGTFTAEHDDHHLASIRELLT